ncbi:hypothetical protein FA95DRAFT_281988 [Auriscalpium vulgare]|uniref:Uncharacterized protein n=1 Tax=Auriscalpium vulgare TaxID=40419 RepID=A0ACB8S5P2_9AGAM|nr:hypothetical protein FA95DRAFT_281988 [Auriscalpium vulgare]
MEYQNVATRTLHANSSFGRRGANLGSGIDMHSRRERVAVSHLPLPFSLRVRCHRSGICYFLLACHKGVPPTCGASNSPWGASEWFYHRRRIRGMLQNPRVAPCPQLNTLQPRPEPCGMNPVASDWSYGPLVLAESGTKRHLADLMGTIAVPREICFSQHKCFRRCCYIHSLTVRADIHAVLYGV